MSVPLVILGVFGVRITPAQALYLLSALCEAAGAIVALTLTANILFTQLQAYALPVRFLLVWDNSTKVTFTLLASATLLPAVLILFGAYAASDVAVLLFAASLGALGLYIRSRPKSVSLDRFFDEMVTHPSLRGSSAAELYHMCLSALDKHDLDTFRKACLLLFSIDVPSDALYQFWNGVLERVQDEPQAVTPLAEAIYVCASPIAQTHVIGAATRARPGGGAIVNPLFSCAVAEQSPHYLTRLLLLSSTAEPGRGALVRQELVEDLLLLVLDLVTTCEAPLDGQLAPLGDVTIPTLLGYLDESDDDVLLRVLRGDAVYHYLLFGLPGAERFPTSVRRRLEEARRKAWDRIVAHLYYDHGWDKRPKLQLALWRDGDGEPDVVEGPRRIEEILGGRGEDGLKCEWHPPARSRDLLMPRR
jgi:hypothetical protein